MSLGLGQATKAAATATIIGTGSIDNSGTSDWEEGKGSNLLLTDK